MYQTESVNKSSYGIKPAVLNDHAIPTRTPPQTPFAKKFGARKIASTSQLRSQKREINHSSSLEPVVPFRPGNSSAVSLGDITLSTIAGIDATDIQSEPDSPFQPPAGSGHTMLPMVAHTGALRGTTTQQLYNQQQSTGTRHGAQFFFTASQPLPASPPAKILPDHRTLIVQPSRPLTGIDCVPGLSLDNYSAVDWRNDKEALQRLKELAGTWGSNFEFEQGGTASKGVVAELMLTQVLKSTDGLGTPNPIRTAVICYLLHQCLPSTCLAQKFLTDLYEELLCSVYLPTEAQKMTYDEYSDVGTEDLESSEEDDDYEEDFFSTGINLIGGESRRSSFHSRRSSFRGMSRKSSRASTMMTGARTNTTGTATDTETTSRSSSKMDCVVTDQTHLATLLRCRTFYEDYYALTNKVAHLERDAERLRNLSGNFFGVMEKVLSGWQIICKRMMFVGWRERVKQAKVRRRYMLKFAQRFEERDIMITHLYAWRMYTKTKLGMRTHMAMRDHVEELVIKESTRNAVIENMEEKFTELTRRVVLAREEADVYKRQTAIIEDQLQSKTVECEKWQTICNQMLSHFAQLADIAAKPLIGYKDPKKTKKSVTQGGYSGEAAEKVLLSWINITIKPLAPDNFKEVKNFSSHLADGIALTYLVHQITDGEHFDLHHMLRQDDQRRVDCITTIIKELTGGGGNDMPFNPVDILRGSPEHNIVIVYMLWMRCHQFIRPTNASQTANRWIESVTQAQSLAPPTPPNNNNTLSPSASIRGNPQHTNSKPNKPSTSRNNLLATVHQTMDTLALSLLSDAKLLPPTALRHELLDSGQSRPSSDLTPMMKSQVYQKICNDYNIIGRDSTTMLFTRRLCTEYVVDLLLNKAQGTPTVVNTGEDESTETATKDDITMQLMFTTITHERIPQVFDIPASRHLADQLDLYTNQQNALIQGMLKTYEKDLKQIFRQYCDLPQGAPPATGRMHFAGFLRLATDCKFMIISPVLSKDTVINIFRESNINRDSLMELKAQDDKRKAEEAAREALAVKEREKDHLLNVDDKKKKKKHDIVEDSESYLYTEGWCLNGNEWVESLVRFAYCRYVLTSRKLVDTSEALNILLTRDIFPRAVITDCADFKTQMWAVPVQALLKEARPKLTRLYGRFANTKTGAPGTKGSSSTASSPKTVMNSASFTEVWRECSLIEGPLTEQACSDVFDQFKDSNNPYMFYSDFEAAVVAVAVYKQPSPFTPLQTRLHSFFEQQLSPALLAKLRIR